MPSAAIWPAREDPGDKEGKPVTEVVAAPARDANPTGKEPRMKDADGLGNVYRPSYRDKRTGELRKASRWWIVYHVNGRRIVENARTTKESEAWKLLKSASSRSQMAGRSDLRSIEPRSMTS